MAAHVPLPAAADGPGDRVDDHQHQGGFGGDRRQQTAFARTPKYRVVSKRDKSVAAKKYRKRLGFVPYIELPIGTYFALTVWYAMANENYFTVPFLILFVFGYWYTGLMSLLQGRFDALMARAVRTQHQTLSGGNLRSAKSDEV